MNLLALNLVKALIKLRQASPALNHGNYVSLSMFEREVMAYLRTEGLENFLIALNFSDKAKG